MHRDSGINLEEGRRGHASVSGCVLGKAPRESLSVMGWEDMSQGHQVRRPCGVSSEELSEDQGGSEIWKEKEFPDQSRRST